MPDESVRRAKALIEVEVEVWSEFSTDEELDELLTRCLNEGDNATSSGVREALRARIAESRDVRVGYTADGNKEAYLGNDLDVTIVNLEILPR